MDKEFNKTESDQPEQIDQTFTKPDKSGEFIVFEDFMRLFSAAINNPALAKRLKALRINRRKNPKKYPNLLDDPIDVQFKKRPAQNKKELPEE